MRGTKAKRLRKAGLKAGPAERPVGQVHEPKPFDHKAERRSRKFKDSTSAPKKGVNKPRVHP